MKISKKENPVKINGIYQYEEMIQLTRFTI